MHLTKKQHLALNYLQDNITNEVLFGGGAGGGKSVLGCYWILKNCFKYPGTRWLIGRAVLKTLKETTIKTLFEVISIQGIDSKLYHYNQQSNEIKFLNKSEIIFKDLYTYSTDPNHDELGSLEITGAFIDEAIQVTKKAKNIVKSRIRFKLDENNLIPKILYTTNPGRGWIYDEFYKLSVDNELPDSKKFIQSLLFDNPNISSFYQENLEALDIASRERLLNGNWNYIENSLIKYEWFEFIETHLDLQVDLWIDGAYTKNTSNDPTGIIVCFFHNDTLFILHAVSKHMELPELLKFIPTYTDNFNFNNISRIFIEPKASGKSLKQMLSKDRFNAIEIKSKLVSEGKESRAQIASVKIESGKVKILKGNWNDGFIGQLIGFPSVEHDEYIDLLGYACDYYFKRNKMLG